MFIRSWPCKNSEREDIWCQWCRICHNRYAYFFHLSLKKSVEKEHIACLMLHFWKGEGYQGIFSLVKGTSMRNILISIGIFKGHQGMARGNRCLREVSGLSINYLHPNQRVLYHCVLKKNGKGTRTTSQFHLATLFHTTFAQRRMHFRNCLNTLEIKVHFCLAFFLLLFKSTNL